MPPLIGYVGGKHYAVKHILPHLPTTFRRYYEPFIGGGAIFLAARQRWRAQWRINDLAPYTAALWRVVRDRPHDLIRFMDRLAVECGLDCRALYERCAGWHESDCPIRLAAWLIIRSETTYGATLWGGFRLSKQVRSGLSKCLWTPYLRGKIADTSPLLAGATITQADYADAIAGATGADVIYLDPPYLEVGDQLYLRNDFDHDRLASVLANCPARWVLSYNDRPEIKRRYRGCRFIKPRWKYAHKVADQWRPAASSNELLIRNW